MTHTSEILARTLETAGLTQMAANARAHYYHDYLSPLGMPAMQLVADLQEAEERYAKEGKPTAPVAALRIRVVNGDFDATKEESEEWAASEDGQSVFDRLIRGE